MHAKHWTTLLFAGCLGVGGMVRGQVAPPPPADSDQELLIQPAPPAAPVPAQPGFVAADPFTGRPPVALQPPGGMAPGAPPALLQVQPRMPGYGGGYRVLTTRQGGGSWMGVAVSPASEALRRQLRLRDGAGLVVERVMPHSPADRAGIEQYDVLETLDDQILTNPQELLSMVRSHRSGDEVTLGIIREGKHREVTLKVSRTATNIARPPQPQMPGMYPPATPAPAPRFGGGGAGGFGFFQPRAPQPANPAVPYPDYAPQNKGQGSSVSLYFRGGQLFATIYDASGRVMMTGPVEALRNQKNLPRDARKALEQLRDEGSGKIKDKTAKLRKHRQKSDDEEDEDDDDAPRAR